MRRWVQVDVAYNSVSSRSETLRINFFVWGPQANLSKVFPVERHDLYITSQQISLPFAPKRNTISFQSYLEPLFPPSCRHHLAWQHGCCFHWELLHLPETTTSVTSENPQGVKIVPHCNWGRMLCICNSFVLLLEKEHRYTAYDQNMFYKVLSATVHYNVKVPVLHNT